MSIDWSRIPESHKTFLRMDNHETPAESDGFSKPEIALIRRYGHWLHALSTGTILPYNRIQQLFYAMCKDCRKPRRKFEVAWYRFMEFCKRKRATQRRSAKSRRISLPADNPFEDIPHYTANPGELPSTFEDVQTLARILASPAKKLFDGGALDAGFQILLPQSLGCLIPGTKRNYLVFYLRKPGDASAAIPVAWLSIDSFHNRYVHESLRRNHDLRQAVVDVIRLPVWSFVCRYGRRYSCIFCGRQLEVVPSTRLGYGPVCARHHGLVYE